MIKLAANPSCVSSRKSYPGSNFHLSTSTGGNRTMKLFGALSLVASRVESWRSSHVFLSPAPPRQFRTFGFPEYSLPFTSPSSYAGELPNSHGRTLTDKSHVLHGIPYHCLGIGSCLPIFHPAADLRQSPSSSPMGSKPSTRSHTALIIMMMGTPSNKPHTPHSQPQKSTAMKTATGFIRLVRPISHGVSK